MRLVEELRAYSVIVPDLPGFGQSEAMDRNSVEDYASFVLESFRVLALAADTVLLGHSFGSIVCSRFAVEYPRLFSELILVNPICEPALQGPGRIASKAAEFYYAAGAALPERAGSSLLRSVLVARGMSWMMAKTNHRETRRYIHGQHLAYFGKFANRTALLETFRTSISNDVLQVASQLLNPVLLVVAEKDDLGSVPAQRRLAEVIPDSTLRVIAGVGHLIHYETPGVAAELINEFLSGRHQCTLS
ncbi:hypothetical protein GCM10009611_06170 [Arthrobacter roseus]